MGVERWRLNVECSAFTLVELLVVVAIIAALLSLLTPALDQAVEQAVRARCGANLHAIQVGATQYALENKQALFIPWARSVVVAVAPAGVSSGSPATGGNRANDNQVDWLAAMATVGLASRDKQDVSNTVSDSPSGQAAQWQVSSDKPAAVTGNSDLQHRPTNVWLCPTVGRDWMVWDGTAHRLGYQWLGGVEMWRNPFATRVASRSPVKLSRSGPDWVMAVDAAYRVNGAWNSNSIFPAHRSEKGRPYGANHTLVDGSVEWVDFDQMMFIHSWGNANRDLFFFQRDLGDYNPPAGAYGSDPAWN